ncbi:noggin-1 [Clinocottus analis]|uniref:noggin-1 n=1 Tax=Clinocottus analis TaxID=304258 RepID=UPI0035BF68B8
MEQTPPCAAMYLLLLSLGVLAQRSLCQHYFILRPVPSDSLPLVELKEDPDPVFDPRERDLNETELKSILGDFDGRYLSVSPPSAAAAAAAAAAEEDKYTGNDELDDFEARQKPGGGVLPKEIRAVDFDVQLGKRHKPSKKLKRRLQQWLWAYSFCPVAHAWTDLGTRFWPRFVRAGGCPGKRSCSVPEGMLCRPANSTHLTVLRWRCVPRKAGLKCAWIPVQYPVITDCKCACASKEEKD